MKGPLLGVKNSACKYVVTRVISRKTCPFAGVFMQA